MTVSIQNDEFNFTQIAEMLSGIQEAHFLADYDAIPYGEEKFRTVHFGWSGPDKTGEMITVSTNSNTNGWEIKVSSEDLVKTLEFRDGAIFEILGEDLNAVYEHAEDVIPSAIEQLVQSSRDAGLSSFDYMPEMEAAPSAAPQSPKL